MKKLFLMILICLLPMVQSANAYAIDTDNELTVGTLHTIKFSGLTANTHYIVVYSYNIDNYTFQASGYTFTYKLLLDSLEADTLTISLYEYSTVTEQNSSAVLLSYLANVYELNSFDVTDSIITAMIFILPIAIIVTFVYGVKKVTIKK